MEHMEYISKPTGRPVDLYIFGLAVTGAVFWSLTYFNKRLTALYQLIGMIMFGVALYFLIRYRLTSFRLKIEGKNGVPCNLAAALPCETDFVAERVQGRKSLPLARLSLDRLRSAEVIRGNELKAKANGASLYRYHGDMSPDEGCLLVFDDDGGEVAIFTELSAEMMAHLRKTVADGGVTR